MSNQEQYEEICNKAKKYDELVKAIKDIKGEIEEDSMHIKKENADGSGGYYILMVPTVTALRSIDRHTRGLME